VLDEHSILVGRDGPGCLFRVDRNFQILGRVGALC
jgi:hypothetical protein